MANRVDSLKKEGSMESMQSPSDRLEVEFNMSREQCVALAKGLGAAMDEGLAGRPSDLRMLPSYVVNMPNGQEEGTFYALDLGGTNFRVLRVILKKGDAPKVQYEKFVVDKEHMTGTGEALFDFLAESIRTTIVKMGDELAPSVPHYLGFTFSFPCEQSAIDCGRLVWWTKGFTASGVEGEEVVGLLQKALTKLGVKVKVDAIVNDTVGTLMAKKITEPDSSIGVIFGTGSNACYVESISNICKLKDYTPPPSGKMIINIEWGNFGQSSENKTLLPHTDLDDKLDSASANKGKQMLEKLVGGMYLGELCRLWFNNLIDQNVVTARAKGGGHLLDDAFTSPLMSHILTQSGGDAAKVKAVMEQELGCENVSEADAERVYRICNSVCERAGQVGGAAIAGVILHMNGWHKTDESTKTTPKGRIIVGIDGSVFTCLEPFRNGLNKTIASILGEEGGALVHLQEASDGLKGSGCCGARCLWNTHQYFFRAESFQVLENVRNGSKVIPFGIDASITVEMQRYRVM